MSAPLLITSSGSVVAWGPPTITVKPRSLNDFISLYVLLISKVSVLMPTISASTSVAISRKSLLVKGLLNEFIAVWTVNPSLLKTLEICAILFGISPMIIGYIRNTFFYA